MSLPLTAPTPAPARAPPLLLLVLPKYLSQKSIENSTRYDPYTGAYTRPLLSST